MRRQDGLLDFIGVGCVVEFATALNRERYAEGYDPTLTSSVEDLAGECQARTMFRVIMKTFATKFTTVIKGKVVHPSYVWQKILVQFAAAVVAHMEARSDEAEGSPGRTPIAVQEALRRHLQLDHPHLVAPFDAALKEDPKPASLTWDGPRIKIRRKGPVFDKVMGAMGAVEALDWDERRLQPIGEHSGTKEVDEYYKGVWREGEPS